MAITWFRFEFVRALSLPIGIKGLGLGLMGTCQIVHWATTAFLERYLRGWRDLKSTNQHSFYTLAWTSRVKLQSSFEIDFESATQLKFQFFSEHPMHDSNTTQTVMTSTKSTSLNISSGLPLVLWALEVLGKQTFITPSLKTWCLENWLFFLLFHLKVKNVFVF